MGSEYEHPFICQSQVDWARGWVQQGWFVEVEAPESAEYADGDSYDYYDDASFESRVRANHLSAPALLQFNPISSVHLLAGPVLSFALGCSAAATAEVDGTVTESDSGDCDDANLDQRIVDLSIMVGAGVSIPVSSAFSVSLEAVNDLGMTGFSPENGNDGSINKRSSGFQPA